MGASTAAIYFCFTVIFGTLVFCNAGALPCALRSIQVSRLVCVCNSTYCDTAPEVKKVPVGSFVVYTSSKDGLRFSESVSAINSSTTAQVLYKIQRNFKRQTIIGFGGAFTDAAGINIASLPSAMQDSLLNSYFSDSGIGYTVGRVPMASCDFSTHQYSYDDVPGDFNLSKFSLAPEDMKYKIPYIHKAMKVSPLPIKMFASPWSAPAWMKTNKNMTGQGSLIGSPGEQYYKTWANYFVRFLQEYAKHNVSFWGITAQNEPTDGDRPAFPFQAMGFTPEMQRDFIKMDLGPALSKAGFDNVKLMILDDIRVFILKWVDVVLSDPEVYKYVSGVGVHWYIDALVPANVLTMAHNAFPDKFLLATEACEGSFPWEISVDLGSWDRAKGYANDIIQDLNNWVTGWVDWNMALSMEGGPNWVNNLDDSPIIVNADKQEFYKQPMFYAMGHFSKFLVPGSVWVEVQAVKEAGLIEITAFTRPDNSVAVVIHNMGLEAVNLALQDEKLGYLQVVSPPDSIQTVLYWLS